MRINVKFHALAISIISAVIVVIFLLFGYKEQKPAEPVKLTSADSYARIASATWGSNCNTFIDAELALQARNGLAKNEKGEVIPAPVLKKVEANNVLDNIKALCDGKPICETPINSDVLGVEPLADCFKNLEVAYRCFETDLLRTLTVGQDQNLSINCMNPMAANAPASAQ